MGEVTSVGYSHLFVDQLFAPLGSRLHQFDKYIVGALDVGQLGATNNLRERQHYTNAVGFKLGQLSLQIIHMKAEMLQAQAVKFGRGALVG